MTLIGKPLGGPDVVGGLFPRSERYTFRSRAGAALSQGSVVCVDISGSATEITTTDSNSGRPGYGDASGDTIWNTVVDPDANYITGTEPTVFGVTIPSSIADNDSGMVQIFGRVENARVVASGTISNMVYGTPLTATTTNSFNATITSNQRVVGFFCGASASVTNSAELHPVFLHQGVFFHGDSQNIVVA